MTQEQRLQDIQALWDLEAEVYNMPRPVDPQLWNIIARWRTELSLAVPDMETWPNQRSVVQAVADEDR